MGTPEEEQAKAKAEAEEKETANQEAAELREKAAREAEEKSAPKPKPGKGEGEPSVEELEQRYKTLQGIHTKTQEELTELKKQGQDFEGLRQTVEQQGANMELVIDVLGSMAEGNEDLQAKVKKSQEEIGKRAEAQKQFNSTFTQMGGIAKIAGLTPQDETLKPAFEALNKGDYPSALNLTTLAVQARVSSAGFKSPSQEAEETSEAEKEKEKEKKKLPVSTRSSAAPQDWRDLPAKDKITEGLREKREES